MRRTLPLFVALAFSGNLAHGQTYIDLHDFGGTTTNANGSTGPDGGYPYASVAFDRSGNMYGTTYNGGANFDGTVWEITPSGIYKDLHDFGGTVKNANGQDGPDGNTPLSGVTVDSAGNLYGTTWFGGLYGKNPNPEGMVWEITNDGVYLDLHDFGAAGDGTAAVGGVTLDAHGNLFGTAGSGGANQEGILWELTTGGVYKDLHDFGGTVTNADGTKGPDGDYPHTLVVFDGNGNLFGCASLGGPHGSSVDGGGGELYEITTSGTYIDLHDFGAGTDGAVPNGVTLDGKGNLYGTAAQGGANTTYVNAGNGMVWTLSPSGIYKDLHDFGGTIKTSNGKTGSDGFLPQSAVAVDGTGDIFGTAFSGGPDWSYSNQYGGMIWEITSAGAYVDLHDFGGKTTNADGKTGPDGNTPYAGVTLDAGGNLYGTTYDGGAFAQKFYGMTWLISYSTLKSVGVAPSTVIGGATSLGTVNLTTAAPTGGITIGLSSNSASATLPKGVKVPGGAASATFTVQSVPVAAIAIATLTATGGVVKESAKLTIDPPTLKTLSLNPVAVVGGAVATGTISLTGPAPTAGVTVNLSASSAGATVPSTITVAAGKTSATFSVSTVAVAAKNTVTIKSTLGTASISEPLSLYPPQVSSVALSPTTVVGGASSTGSVTLAAAAPTGGVVVPLSSGSPTAGVPATVTVSAGSTSATFTVKTTPVASGTNVSISATDGLVTRIATLMIDPPTVSSITLASSSIIGGTQAGGVVALNGAAPAGGITVSLSSNSNAASVPLAVTVLAGKNFVVFTLSSVPVAANKTLTITGKTGSVSASAKITIDAPSLTSLTLSPTSVVGGASSTGTVAINGQAPAGGFTVAVSSNSASATVQGSAVIPAGKVSATFTVKTPTVKSQTTATITAKSGSVSKTATLTIKT